MSWSFEAEVELLPKNFSTTLTLSIFGGVDTKVNLDFVATAVKKAIIAGGIDYDCKKSKAKGDGTRWCTMYDLKRRAPQVTTPISATLLKDIVPPKLTIPGLNLSASLKQPVVTVTPTMQVTSTNEGQCYNVFVDILAEFTPGQIEFSVKLPNIPVLGSLTVGGTANVGTAAKTRMQAEYRVCCCSWNDNLEKVREDLDDEHDTVDQDDLKCGDSITNLSCDVTGDKAMFAVKIKAIEHTCPFSNHMSPKKGKMVKTSGTKPEEVTHP
jgi:hypothetical protein